jgi:hypothetical protein
MLHITGHQGNAVWSNNALSLHTCQNSDKNAGKVTDRNAKKGEATKENSVTIFYKVKYVLSIRPSKFYGIILENRNLCPYKNYIWKWGM